ncbi:MAG: restriction endonuclease [Deltaproteobacteria bacterium]|nr:restriction endonuclease [Deltaproteobacteria bacterium]
MTRVSTNSTLPAQAAFHHAVLRHLALHPDGDRRRNIHEAVPDLMGLNEVQRTERLANLPHLRYRHRSGWALSMLKAAGYVDSPDPGIWRITDRGRTLLARYPDGFDTETAREVIREGRREIQGEDASDGSPLGEVGATIQQTPDERIDTALGEIHRLVAEELLDKIAQAPPVFFEDLVLDLLHALGYGASEEDLERVGHSGDGGIDGVISLDKLGFERVYVQAKRWQGSVGRPEVQAFYGALAGRRARKGVFITTSGFTREAREFGSQMADTIVLIDGPRLTSLMIDNGVGVTHYRVLRLPRVDDDYFDGE